MQQFIVYKKYKSTRSSIRKLECELDSLRQKLNLTDADFFRLNICVTEIFVNAVYHGNKVDPDKYVEILIHADTQNVNVLVIDEGNGFSLSDVPDPIANENLLKDAGRGIFITKNYAKTINFKHSVRGFCVEFNLTMATSLNL